MKIINSKIVNGKKMFLIEEPTKKLGGVIEDNQGQWKYPGQITKINSPNITMKGVNYPVLGISEQTGEQKLMFPENNYKFKSTKAVIEYPITAQAGTTVKINKDNVVKEYDRRSPEYKAMYDSGRLMSYDKSTDTYRATPLETFEVKTKAPQWLINKRNIEKNFTKEKFVKKYLPKWSGSMGETADNLSENAQKDYDKKVNDKLANVLLKSNQKKGNKEANNLDWYNSFSEKEREIIQQSSLANKFAPAQRAYDLDVSNSTKKYNTTDVLTDADKLSQSVQGTPERFRLFPNAENNIESYVNPGMFIGSMAKGLGNVPKDIKNENYGQAALSIATPLGVGALAGIGNPSIKQFVNNIANPFAGTGNLVNKLGNKYLPNEINPLNLKSKSALNWMEQWYSHPDFLNRYKNTGSYFPEFMQERVLRKLEKYEPKNYIDLLKDKGFKTYAKKSISSGGVSWGVPNEIYVNRTMYAPFNKKGLESVRAHELTHLIESNGHHLSSLDEEVLLKPFGYSSFNEVPKTTKKFSMPGESHYLDPTEIHARMNQARFDLGLTPDDKFTAKMFEDISKNKNWYGMDRYIKDKSSFIENMNKFWAVPPAVVAGKELSDQKEFGGKILNTKIENGKKYFLINE